ncbi:threonine/homoserine efflux transporter RhtA [Aneurinibacillus soli]|uniref:EamA-like transporter family protein n=1 Tax=Aneurinibacillus soli TaxID=1500254 RepID=A0A0U5AZA7_9BACL|nr:DMT family transporter [Aneurinibacillus soli]PYE63723.1 threonine/homoserine efflux transporter RhtA [Aneurinibacillus soli]BAU27344.1 EamA-like transporter family protein [Aneurinibacillus soli]
MSYFRSVLLVFAASCSYGVLSTFVKFAYAEGFGPGDVSGSQMFLGMLIMWGIALTVGKFQLSAKQWGLLVVAGTTSGLTGLFYYRALQYIPASLAIILLFQFTWMGVLIELIIEKRKLGVSRLVALVFLFGGTVLASGIVEEGLQKLSLAGTVLGLLSAVMYALFIIASGKAAPEVNPYWRAAIMLIGSVAITFAISPPHFLVNGALADGLWRWGILLALFGAIIPPLFFAIGVPRIGSGLASILGAAELPTAVLMSRFVLGEHVGGLQWIGVIVILAGIIVPEWLAVRRTKETSRTAS